MATITNQSGVNVIKGSDGYNYTSQDQSAYKRDESVMRNPKGELDENAFLKLFIETLKNQTPDSTTDIKEIMQYTSSMTTVQTNNANKKALEKVVETLSNNSNYSTRFGVLPAIGKLAVTNQDTLSYAGEGNLKSRLYADHKIKSGTFEVTNSSGKVVREVSLSEYINAAGQKGRDEDGAEFKGSQGLVRLNWNGYLDDGTVARKGSYGMQLRYKDDKGIDRLAKLGEYKVESVKFKKGEPYLNMGGFDVKFSDVKELRAIG